LEIIQNEIDMSQMNLPWVESPFFSDIIKTKNISVEDKKLASEYYENGFIVLSNVFTNELIDKIKSEMNEKGFNENFPIQTFRNNIRIQDLWQYSDSVKELACHPKIMDTLKMLYEREPVPFQTLNFKVGTQQKAHSDTLHFSSLPARYMCGVWVALEDITEDNGPLFYYPGSHRNPEYNFSDFKNTTEDTSYENYPEYETFMEDLMEKSSYKKKKFLAKKGDALIWSSNIIHGGSPVEDPQSTRYSQVTHYYFENCIYYTPMLSNMVTKELFIRRNLVDIKTGKIAEQNFNGNHAQLVRTRGSLYAINNHIKLPKILRFLASKL
jgi:ectoine hydroxylase-related dioxygenase (phytanoyl-CoA dioxygenase family)